MPRGGQVVAVLSDFREFPQQIVGGGSGEVFRYCLPWTIPNDAPAPPRQDVVVIPFPVPAEAPLGPGELSVVFSQATTGLAAPDEELVALTVSFTVTNGPAPAGSPDDPPCGITAGQPRAGTLTVSPARVAADGSVRVAIPDPPADLVRPEGSDYYVVCLNGRAVVPPTVAQPAGVPSLAVDVLLPAGAPTGAAPVRVLALAPSGWVAWSGSVQIRPAVQPAPRTPIGGVDAGGGALAGQPADRDTGVLARSVGLLAALGLAAVVALVRRRRT